MSAATTSTRSAPPRRRRKDDTKLALMFIAPATVGLLLFLVWPLLTGIYYSFTEYTTLSPPEWVGFDNYQAMFADPVFWNALKVTLVYVAINIGVQTVVALGIAVLMQRLTQSTILRSLVLAGPVPGLQRGRRDRVPVDPGHPAGHLQHLPAVDRLRPGGVLGQ